MNKILELPVTQYKNYIDQAFNLSRLFQEPRFNKGGKWVNQFETITTAQKEEIYRNTFEMLREKRNKKKTVNN